MVGSWIKGVPGSLALVTQRGRWWRLSWSLVTDRRTRPLVRRATAEDRTRRFDEFRYHLGRGRRAREAGRFEQGATAARRALAIYPSDPWALALLGQCLYRQRVRDLPGARRALERAWALDQTNGYFVGLLLDVLQAQGEADASRDLLNWAWWLGAPVERWLPDGPPMPTPAERAARVEGAGQSLPNAARRVPSVTRAAGSSGLLTGPQPVPA